MNVNISLSQIAGEKIMELQRGVINIQVTTNISIVKLIYSEEVLDCSFVFVVNYIPAVANLTIKGSAKITGEKKELEEIKKSFDDNKALPQPVLQTISNISFIEGIILARSLNIPPPIPLPTLTQQQTNKEIGVRPSYIA
jgi:hypothetical protein